MSSAVVQVWFLWYILKLWLRCRRHRCGPCCSSSCCCAWAWTVRYVFFELPPFECIILDFMNFSLPLSRWLSHRFKMGSLGGSNGNWSTMSCWCWSSVWYRSSLGCLTWYKVVSTSSNWLITTLLRYRLCSWHFSRLSPLLGSMASIGYRRMWSKWLEGIHRSIYGFACWLLCQLC